MSPAVVPEAPHGYLPVLDEAQAARAVADVDAEVGRWTRRELSPVDFYTLGAASYLDAVGDVDVYFDRARTLNPVLRARFSWVYERVLSALSSVFGMCDFCEPLAVPGFHIFGHRPGALNNSVTMRAMQGLVASIHADRQYEQLAAVWSRFSDVDLKHTMTFTLALDLPRRGGGLCFWGDDGLARYDDDGPFVSYVKREMDYRGIKNVAEPIVVPYRVGSLFYFMGLTKHQIAPSWQIDLHDRRITLQGHGLRCDGVWRLYF